MVIKNKLINIYKRVKSYWPYIISQVILIFIIHIFAIQRYDLQNISSKTTLIDCNKEIEMKPNFMINDSAIQKHASTVVFSGISGLYIDICDPGILSFKIRGDLGGNEKPQLQISLNSKVINVVTAYQKEHKIQIPINRPGRLTLNYLNDFHIDQTRILTLRHWKMDGLNCNTYDIKVPPQTGGTWYAVEGIATLQTNQPMQFIPCAAGKLTLMISSTRVQDDLDTAILEVKQKNQMPYEIPILSNINQKVQIHLDGSITTLRLKNPFRKIIFDRNVIISEVTFRDFNNKISMVNLRTQGVKHEKKK